MANLLATPLTTAQSSVLEEVIVIAQKRERSPQEIPVAISTFNAAALEQQGIKNVFDVGQFVFIK